MFRSNGLWNTLLEHGKPKSPESDTLIQQKLILQAYILDLIATSDQIQTQPAKTNLASHSSLGSRGQITVSQQR